MSKFRKKPVEIEAVQFDGKNFPTMHKFIGKSYEHTPGEFHWGFIPANKEERERGLDAVVWDKLHETWVGVKSGNWIIKGIQGEFYPCDPDVFADSYDPVED